MSDTLEDSYYYEVLGGPPEPPEINNGKWIGKDKAIVEHHPINPIDNLDPSWYDSDNNARSPLEADWEDIDGR